jgi:hypothetical protein
MAYAIEPGVVSSKEQPAGKGECNVLQKIGQFGLLKIMPAAEVGILSGLEYVF